QILESTETSGIADPALEQIPAAIVAAQSTDVDVVAGASFASRAIMTAVDDCLVQAGLKEAPPETTAAPAPEAGSYKAGTYSATAQGMGKVTVTITIDESGKIAACEIDASGETPGLGDKAAEKLVDKILAAQSAEIDGISGASMTSGAVKTALSDCLAQASN
ncbi:MAG: FMN-binding protein, partial [Lachnospiraceae bacterium]|nr:FMN-binding protein [Lachnospiraceae bacterium]